MREAILKIYDEVVATNPNFERKGKTMPYTSANGYMFSLISKDDELGIRLSKEATIEFDKAFGAKPFKSHGATMREYVLIPESLLADQETLGKYLQKGYEHVMSLPPK
ncbi:TfoX/Sxy family protein [Flagellimonas sp.]|uniref:TfoX/Sxy family protein n=1 Tax=Flagellimonas sp. TaxID=2058762 RepID=UPI003B58DF38